MQSACIRGKGKSVIKRSWTVAAPRSTYICSVIWPYQLSKERLLDIFDRIGTSRHRFSRRTWIMNIWMTLQQKPHLNTMYVGADMVIMDMLMVSYNHLEQSTPLEATKMDSNLRWNTAHCLSSSRCWRIPTIISPARLWFKAESVKNGGFTISNVQFNDLSAWFLLFKFTLDALEISTKAYGEAHMKMLATLMANCSDR